MRSSDLALIIYTSGSTGDPKGPVHTQGTLVRHTYNLTFDYGVTTDTVMFTEEIADLKNASLAWWILEGKIKGLDEFRKISGGTNATDYAEVVQGLRATDRYATLSEAIEAVRIGRDPS